MDPTSDSTNAQALGLQIYPSKYQGKCTICREPFKPGDMIAFIHDKLRQEMNALGLCGKAHKYAHARCVPVLLPPQYITLIKEAAEKLLDVTDPAWPRDFVGFSSADASPCEAWLNAECPRIGAHRVAQRLIKYLTTQLGGQETERGKAIIRAAKARTARDVWDGPSDRPEQAHLVPEAAPPTVEPLEAPVPCEAILGAVVRKHKVQGEAWITIRADGLFGVYLDPPWVSKSHAAVKDEIKRGGGKWDPDEKVWLAAPGLIARLWKDLVDTIKVAVTPDAAEILEPSLQRRLLAKAASVEDAGTGQDIAEKLKSVVPDGLALYPFQEAGVAFIEAANGKAMVSDEMGLGKTVQALVYLAMHAEIRPVLLIVPSIVATNWKRETRKWLPSESVYRIRSGKDPIPESTQILIVTYDMAWRREEDLKAFAPKAIILDECHYAKNIKTKRTKAVLKIAEACNPLSVLALSGTPIVNRPVEFFTALRLLRSFDFRSWKWYVHRYCNAHHNGYGLDVSGASNTEELSSRLKDLMVRRLKKDVLPELPDKIREMVDVEISTKDRWAYDKAVEAAYADNGDGAHLAAITAARHAVGSAKVKAAVEWIREYHDQDQPVVVFAHHQDVLAGLLDGCTSSKIRAKLIDGSTSADKRGAYVEEFQRGDLDAILISTMAGGVGITLTRSSNVLVTERQWTPAAEIQAEDRLHRIGQKSSVLCRYLRVSGTVDQDMDELIEEKREVLHQVLDGAPSEQKLDITSDLIKRWEERTKA